MAPKTAVLTDKAPAPSPFLSQAVIHNDLIYCSGNMGKDPVTGKLIGGGVEARTAQTLRNLDTILKAGGSSLKNALKVNIFLTSMKDYAAMNKAYEAVFVDGTKPVRTCVAVKELPAGTDVEIECTAFLDQPKSKL